MNDLLKAKLSPRAAEVVESLTNADYHAGPGIGKSDLDYIHRSPAHFIASLSAPREETEALMIGTAFHTAVLEPERYEKDYTARPDFNRRTKDGKAAYEEWAKANEGKTALEPEAMEMIAAMRESVLANRIARRLIDDSKHEVSVFEDFDGIPVKCRPDGWIADAGILFDLKSAKDASVDGFAKAAANCRYHVQAAWYKAITEALTGAAQHFYFIAIEKEPPYAVALYEMDGVTMEIGRLAAMNDLDRLRQAVEADRFDAYPKTIEPLTLPAWAMK